MPEWYVRCLDVYEGQVRTSQVRIREVRTGQVRTGQVKTVQVKEGQIKLEMHLRLEFDSSVGPTWFADCFLMKLHQMYCALICYFAVQYPT